MIIAPATYRKPPGVQLVPSADSALALMRGEPGALWAVLTHTLTRALVMAPAGIAAGAALGVRPLASVAVVVGGALAIEAGVLALAWRQVQAERAAVAADAPQADQADPPAVVALAPAAPGPFGDLMGIETIHG